MTLDFNSETSITHANILSGLSMLHFDKVREIAFTPAPPSDRDHEPLISSFALIKMI